MTAVEIDQIKEMLRRHDEKIECLLKKVSEQIHLLFLMNYNGNEAALNMEAELYREVTSKNASNDL